MITPAIPNSVVLKAEHLGRTVGDKILVQDANFEIRAGEVLAIVGPSGSGKSWLLRLLNRLDEPTSGTVFVEGRDYREIPPRELRRARCRAGRWAAVRGGQEERRTIRPI